MQSHLEKYFENSTIHGIRYFSKNFHFIERLFWITGLIASIICTTILIIQLVTKIQNTPIVIYLSDQSVSISELNFPAVSVCIGLNQNFPYGTKTKDISNKFPYFFEKHTYAKIFYDQDEFDELTVDERRLGNISYMEILNKIKNDEINVNDLSLNLLKKLQVIELVSKRDVLSKKNVSISTRDFLNVINEFEKKIKTYAATVEFSWKEKNLVQISEVITEFGLCMTFNLPPNNETLNIDLISEDFHYQYFYFNRLQISQQEIIPRRLTTSIDKLDIDAVGADEFFKNVVNTKLNGYLMLLHDPYELPSKSFQQISVNMDYDFNIFVDPQINAIDDSLIDFEPHERNCYLDDERNLKFFKVYTRANCEAECLTDFMISRCNCAEFYMIRNSTTRICSVNDKSCFDTAKTAFEDYRSICKCLQPCDYVNYNLAIDSKKRQRTVFYRKIYAQNSNFRGTIKFRQNTFNQLIRKKQFDVIDFLSFIGGVLGLFAGFSMLSFVELVYEFTIGLLIKICNKKKIHPKIKQNENKKKKFMKIFRDFFENSSIHGAGYFINTNIIDKTFWIVSVVLSLGFSCYLISKVNQKLPDSRVIAHDDNLMFINNIPFPALTFVPDLIIDQETYYAYLRRRSNDKFDLATFLRGNICTHRFRDNFVKERITLEKLMKAYKNTSQLKWIQQQFASWNDKYRMNFAEIRTIRGNGYSFNLIDDEKLLNLKELSSYFKYHNNYSMINQNKFPTIPQSQLPLKVDTNSKYGFTLRLSKPDYNETIYGACLPSSFLIHHSNFLPTFVDQFEFVEIKYGTTMHVEVTPEMITTETTLKKLSPEVRECYFKGENSLKFFESYSYENCQIECFANSSLDRCGCVLLTQPFYKIRSIELCLKDSHALCPLYARSSKLNSQKFSIEKNCSCLPTCEAINYHIKYYTEFNDDKETVINVRMKVDDLIMYRRYQQFTFSDEVSYVGGLLGLFAGISMLSIVEVAYFFTLRFFVNVLRSVFKKNL